MRAITLSALLALITIAAAAIAVGRAPVTRLAIFDAHIHYSEPAWQPYPPIRIRRLLRDAGIAGAAISSSPDDGTRRLIRLNRARFVAVLRPYRKGVTSANWGRRSFLVRATWDERLGERTLSGNWRSTLSIGGGNDQTRCATGRRVGNRARTFPLHVSFRKSANPIPALAISGAQTAVGTWGYD